MIDLEKISKKFQEYTSNYDLNHGRIRLKVEHIKRVADNSKIIAESLNLSKEQVNLAVAIGFFHDIGRFEQVRRTNTFSDRESKINHGELGVQILFENNFIREFIEDSKYDEIIKKAILNHNRSEIDKNLTEEEALFAKIIRDADKLDIFYIFSSEQYTIENIFWYPEFDCKEISESILQEFYRKIPINYSLVHNNADIIAVFYAYIYDLYFPITRKIVYNKKYLEIFAERICKKFQSEKISIQTKELLNLSLKFLNE